MEQLGEKNNELHEAIVRTLAYFDMFDHPLTLQEIRRYLYRWSRDGASPSLTAIRMALDAPTFEHLSGLWFLVGRKETVAIRHARARLADRKIRRALRFARYARLLPSVRMISVCNRLAYANSRAGGDIDLLMVTRPGMLWITRFVIVSVLAALDLRPREGREADMFCLSFNLTEDTLDIGPLFVHADDIDLTYWAATVLPIYDPYGTHTRFIDANPRVFRDVPGAATTRSMVRRIVPRASRVTDILLPVLRALEPWSHRFQTRRFPEAIRSRANVDTCVVVTPGVLKFHVLDRRAQYAEAHRERVAALRSPVHA